MPLEIDLLGRPRVVGGPGGQPRGRKAWGLLALLVLSDRQVTREYAAAMLFSGSEDPRAALRWNIAQLRGALGGEVLPPGRLELLLPLDAVVDVQALASGDWRQAIAVSGCGRELLEGHEFPGCPEFEAWLLAERRYLAGLAEQALREAALVTLAEGDPRGATSLAVRLVELNPYDDNFQELLVRTYAEAGDEGAARRQALLAAGLARELGREPTVAIARAAAAPVGGAADGHVGRVALGAQVEMGLAAVRAGAVDTGVESLRAAAGGAQRDGETELEARAWAGVGSALVHAARGRDEEGALALHRARVVAERGGHGSVAAAAHNELGYVELLRGRYAGAAVLLARAAHSGQGDDAALAAVHRNRGMALSDVGRYAMALEALRLSLDHARRADDSREECFALSLVGRVQLLRGETDSARATLERSLDLAQRTAWTTFRSWPESLLGAAEFAAGDVDASAEHLEHAFALGCELRDPCWEAVAQRGLGVIAAAAGDFGAAIRQLREAYHRALREPDAYLWVAVYTLDALCEAAVSSGSHDAEGWIADLRARASRAGMRELVARSYLHDVRRGIPHAPEIGRTLAAEVDSPALTRAFPELRHTAPHTVGVHDRRTTPP